jgi:hypothetical protein
MGVRAGIVHGEELVRGMGTETAVYWLYRLSAYVVLNLGEDAALAAFIFC